MTSTRCPNCRAWLNAKTSFAEGEKVTCPKCEAPFVVREPAEGMPRPAKTAAEGEFTVGSGGGSILWYATFALLVAGIAGLGFVLAQKLPENPSSGVKAPPPPDPSEGKQPPGGPPGPGGPPKGPKGKQPNAKQPKERQPKQPNVKPPDMNVKQPMEKLPDMKPEGKPGGITGLALGQLNGVFSGGPIPPDERDRLLQKHKSALVGTWTADLGGGVTEELAYTADGAFTAKRAGTDPAMATGKYMVKDLLGTKTVKIQLDTADGARTVTAVLEGDELHHPTLQKGVVGVFRKK
jgi:hypothetical protein